MALGTLITVVAVLVIIGLCVWLIENYVPMPDPFKVVIRVVVVLFLILWLLSVAGLWSGFKV
jgi:hypothetical protein